MAFDINVPNYPSSDDVSKIFKKSWNIPSITTKVTMLLAMSSRTLHIFPYKDLLDYRNLARQHSSSHPTKNTN
jgi:hypothetical protein